VKKVKSVLFVRYVLCDRIESLALASLFRYDGNTYSRRRNVRLITFFHRTDYGKFKPLNNVKLNFHYHCVLFGFRSEDVRGVFLDGL
jgi:hypothetical protein